MSYGYQSDDFGDMASGSITRGAAVKSGRQDEYVRIVRSSFYGLFSSW